MALKLYEGALPKGVGGRKAREADAELLAAIKDLLTKTPTIGTGDDERPRIVGDPARLFSTEGKASSDGRLYARPIAEALGKVVRVRVVDGADTVKDEEHPEGKQYGWVLYIPTEAPTEPATG